MASAEFISVNSVTDGTVNIQVQYIIYVREARDNSGCAVIVLQGAEMQVRHDVDRVMQLIKNRYSL